MISAWWLLAVAIISLIIGIGIGAFLMSWYFSYQLKKTMGTKSWKKFYEQVKELQRLREQMKKGPFQMDEDLRKKMEEIAKRFSQNN